MHLCYINILIFTMYSTCFEPEGSSSGILLYVQVWYNCLHASGMSSLVVGKACSVPNLLPEDEHSGSKHVEDIEI